MASIGWIDFSPTHRERVGSVLDLLKPEGMVDELGVGTIRDAIANELFPGISTIQTRAKYFFIVPYILRDYQALMPSSRKGKTAIQYLEQEEYEVMWDLAEQYKFVDGNGVIGITKRRKQKIVRRPSAIYWNGLNLFGFIDSQGLSANNFLRKASNSNLESLISKEKSDEGNDDVDLDYENLLRIRVPISKAWRDNLTLDLTREEAEFFKDKILTVASNKIIAELLVNQELWQLFLSSANFNSFIKTTKTFNLSPYLKTNLTLAHDFSELMYGAHLAYNCQLQQKLYGNNHFDSQWLEWIENIETNMIDYQNFNPNQLLPYSTTTRPSTKLFVKAWWEQVRLGFPDLKKRDTMIYEQELIVKNKKARLSWNKNEEVKEADWIGLEHFEYRFGQARNILKDIKDKIA